MHFTTIFFFPFFLLVVLASPAPKNHLSVCSTKVWTKKSSLGLPDIPTHNLGSRELPDAGSEIKVHWAVISQGSELEAGNIPDDMLNAQIDVLNEDFGPAGLSFKLVETKRVTRPEWFNNPQAEAKFKRILDHVQDPSVLKVYSIRPGLASWAYLPEDSTPSPDSDGVVLTVSGLPNYQPGSTGRTLTHEVGHWTGLYHTFEGGCATDPNAGDRVPDTPPHESPLAITGCETPKYTCGGTEPDPTDNFMSYANDLCRTRFTSGQIERMHTKLKMYRGITAGAGTTTNDTTASDTSGDNTADTGGTGGENETGSKDGGTKPVSGETGKPGDTSGGTPGDTTGEKPDSTTGESTSETTGGTPGNDGGTPGVRGTSGGIRGGRIGGTKSGTTGGTTPGNVNVGSTGTSRVNTGTPGCTGTTGTAGSMLNNVSSWMWQLIGQFASNVVQGLQHYF